MGVLTLADWRAEIEGGLQRSGIGNTLLDKWVNQALKEFAYAFKFHEMEGSVSFNTVIAQNEYSIGVEIIASDFRYVDEVWALHPESLSTYLIKSETRSRYRRKIGVPSDGGSHGLPQWYHRHGNKLIFRPVPDSVVAVTVDYYKSVVPLTQPTHTSQFHEDWDEVISVGALYRGFRHFGEFDRYQNVRNDFLGIVRSRQTEYELEEFPDGGISPLGPNDTETVEST